MKFVFSIMFLCGSLVLILFLFLYFCEKYNLKIPGSSYAPTTVPNSPERYMKTIPVEYQGDYVQFANLVYNCLQALQGKYGLICPGKVTSIYCTDKSDRIQITAKTGIIFRYEITCAIPLTTGGLKNSSPKQMKREDIAKLFQENLHDYMDAGYDFEGKISVWDIGENRGYIEIPGICRYSGTNMGVYTI